MPNPFHQPFTTTQPYGPTTFTSEPPWAGHPHFHRGWDGVPTDRNQWGVGTPIYPLLSGTIWHVGAYEDEALHVIIKHDDGSYGCYWHLDSYQVKTGQRVTTDTQISRMGTTGNSTKPHLHFEWLAAGPWTGLLSMRPLDPTDLIQNTPGASPEQEQVTTREHIVYEIQDIADAIGGDPHYDLNQKDAFNAHVARIEAAAGLEARSLIRDFLRDYGWKSRDDFRAVTADRDTFATSTSELKGETLQLQGVIKDKDTEIEALHIALENTELAPVTEVSVAGITRLRNYLTAFLSKERKGVK